MPKQVHGGNALQGTDKEFLNTCFQFKISASCADQAKRRRAANDRNGAPNGGAMSQ
jgi:hypothetical protein